MKMVMPFEFNQVFHNKKEEDPVEGLKACLKTLCRSETLRYCIHLNLFVSDVNHPLGTLAQQQTLLRMFFDKPDLVRLNNISTLKLDPDRVFFHRMQLLELIRYATLYCPDSNCHKTPIQNKTSKMKFIQAALFASEIAQNKLGTSQELEIKNGSNKREMLLRSIRLTGQTAMQYIDPARAFGRGKILFSDYLPREFPEFQQQFESHTQIKLDEYFSCVFIVLVHYFNINITHDSYIRHLIEPESLYAQIPHMANAFAHYLELSSQNISELQAALWKDGESAEQYSLKPIREKPILHLNGNTAIVIDPILHLETATISPLFLLSRYLADKKINLLGHFGDAFEKYVQDILLKMYEDNGLLLLGNKLMVHGDQICDACVIEDETLILFEMKAAWVRDDKVADPDHTKYLSELRDKYGKRGNAAFQLARAVNFLIDGIWRLEDHDIRKTKRIYPVLVAYDTLLNLPGYFWFFGSEFRAVFEPDAMLNTSKTVMIKHGWEIAPITIITIDVLEDLEASVKNFKLSDLLRDYFAYCDANFRDIDDDLSLSEFINSQYSAKMDRHGNVLKRALDTFEEMKDMIAPSSTNSTVG